MILRKKDEKCSVASNIVREKYTDLEMDYCAKVGKQVLTTSDCKVTQIRVYSEPD